MTDMFAQKDNVLKSVHWYHDQGFSVVPVARGDKYPIMRGWAEETEIDKNEVLDKFKKQLCNVGLVTGKHSSRIINGKKYKLVGIDIDAKHGHDGFKSIEDWQRDHGQFPKTWTDETPNNGIHYYFWVDYDAEIKGTAGKLDGVDIRSDGNCIVVYPSFLDYTDKLTKQKCQGTYNWTISPKDCELAIANKSVMDLLEKKVEKSKKKPSKTAEFDDLNTERTNAISQGGRTSFLIQIIAQQDFKSNLLNEKEIKDLIRLINTNRCVPPLTEEELQKEVFPSITRFNKYDQDKLIFNESMLVSMEDVEVQTVEWLIPNWLPKGTLTIMGGDGGVGKTTLWCSLVANLTNGQPTILEDPATFTGREPQKVLFFSSEDDTSRVIKPRLLANGARMDLIKTIPMASDVFLKLTFDSDLLEQMIQVEKPALCIFDPIQSFVGGDTDMNKRSQMREQLNYLMQLGERYGTAFLVAMHTNKRVSASGRSRFAESTDIYDISRSAILVGNTKNKQIKYIDHAKSNYSSLQSTILFAIEDGKPMFSGTTEKKDYDFMNEKSSQSKGSQVDDAKEFIVSHLRTNGESPWKSMLTEAKDIEGISERTMYRAKKELVKSKDILEIKTSEGKGKGTVLNIKINYQKNDKK